MINPIIQYGDFEKVDMRVGRVISVENFPEARKPAYKLAIDFGPEIGVKKSSAQITSLYKEEELLDRLVVCIINFPPKQIGPFVSECLTCGANDKDGNVVLLSFDRPDIPLGTKIY